MTSPSHLAPSTILVEDTSRRERAKARLYVLCQSVGWGAFMLLQIVFYWIFVAPKDRKVDLLTAAALNVMVATLGLLLTHYARPLINRWGWKNLGWRQLVPRVLLLAALLSVLWSAIGYSYSCAAVVRIEPPSVSLWLTFLVSWIQGTSLLVSWLTIYFIYHLFDRFNRSEIDRLQLMASVKDAELRALKSQINPHFIFNSLNSLRALIDEDPARARQAVTQLANLLRYSLQSAQSETVAFEDELRVVNDYLALEQVRHEERLRLRLDIAPETLGLAVPPLLLQTLVENAVKYGISSRPEGGEIVIVARCEGGELRLRVTNPGELTPGKSARSSTSTGLGLKNAAERLRMFFGDRAQLRLRAEGASVVVAEVTMPVHLSRG